MKHAILVLIVSLSMGPSALADMCPAPTLEQFESAASDAEFGMDVSIDFTREDLCVHYHANCAQRELTDSSPGYYDLHSIYLIIQNNKVVFASTSEYRDMTYGALRGSSTAEADWQTTFQNLLHYGFCKQELLTY